jgi:hypothetical protein
MASRYSSVLDPKLRKVAAESAFAKQGTLRQLKIRAAYALNLDVDYIATVATQGLERVEVRSAVACWREFLQH